MTSEFNIQDWPTLKTQVNITLRKNRRTSRILVFSCNSSSPYLAFEGEVDGAVVLCAPAPGPGSDPEAAREAGVAVLCDPLMFPE